MTQLDIGDATRKPISWYKSDKWTITRIGAFADVSDYESPYRRITKPATEGPLPQELRFMRRFPMFIDTTNQILPYDAKHGSIWRGSEGEH
jgi:hypothetical protein